MKPDPTKAILLLIIIIIFIFLAMAKAQVKIAISPPIRIEWSHDWKDVEGNDECVVAFGIYLQRLKPDTSDLVLIGQTTAPIDCYPVTEFVIDSIPPGEHRIAIAAWDDADNMSAFHYSTDSTAMGGGWTIMLDTIEPAKATDLRVR